MAATKFRVEPRERYIYVYQARVQHRAQAGERGDLNFKFYLIIFEFNFVTCPEGGGSSPGHRSNLRDTHVRIYVYIYIHARTGTDTHVYVCASVYISSPSAQWVVSFYYTPRRKTSGILRSGCLLRAW